MAAWSFKDFVGTRGRFTRASDGTVASGWVDSVNGSRLVVHMALGGEISAGEKFSLELDGRETSATFEAIVERTRSLSVRGTVAEGSTLRIEDTEVLEVLFAAGGPCRISTSSKPYRASVAGLHATLTYDGLKSTVPLIDVSRGGFAVLMDVAPPVGTRVEFEVESGTGPARGSGVVRNGRPWKGQHRIGLQILDMNRLDRPRWARILEEL